LQGTVQQVVDFMADAKRHHQKHRQQPDAADQGQAACEFAPQ
jgi:hypothetical protein